MPRGKAHRYSMVKAAYSLAEATWEEAKEANGRAANRGRPQLLSQGDTDGAAMPDRPIRVLVFPTINEPGMEIVHSIIKSNKVEVYGGSSYKTEYDPSRLLLKNFFDLPPLGAPDFESSLRTFLAEHSIDLVFPTVDSLVAEFSRWEGPSRFVTPDPEVADIVSSKRKTYARLEHAVPVPTIYDDGVPYPAFAKPDRGAGSRDATLIRDANELTVARSSGLMITEWLPGAEYTIDCVSDMQGRLLHSSARIRGQISRGISLGTKREVNPIFNTYAAAISDELKIRGPWFAQFKTDQHGRLKLLEVNARVAGSMALTRYSGVNIPLMSVFLFMGFDVKVPQPVGNVTLNRCLENFVEGAPFDALIWDLDDTLIRKDGKPDPECIFYLFDCANRGKRQFLVSKNADVAGVLAKHQIPQVFGRVVQTGDKIEEIVRLIEGESLDVGRLIVINDSHTELFSLQRRVAGIRIIGPGELANLGREQIA